MLTILPLPLLVQLASRLRYRKKAVFRLVSMIWRPNLLGEVDRIARRMIPALTPRYREPATERSGNDILTGAIEPRSALIAWKRTPVLATISGLSIDERPTAAIEAPASASGDSDALTGMPVAMPVTMAVCPEYRNGLAIVLPQIRDGDMVHVGEVFVVTGHRPDEAVILGAGARVYRPGRRDDRLFAGQPVCGGLLLLLPMKQHAPMGFPGRNRDRSCAGRARAGMVFQTLPASIIVKPMVKSR